MKDSRLFRAYAPTVMPFRFSVIRSKGRAYSMVEMMVVMICLLTLMALLLPILSSSRDTAKIAVCSNNLKQIYNGVLTAAISEHSRIVFPSASEWQTYTEALTESDVLICPMDTDKHFKLLDNETEFIPPPPSVSYKELMSDEKVFIFREKENLKLSEAVSAKVTPGEYTSHDPDGVISAGMTVDVFFFHFDPITDNSISSATLEAGQDNLLGYIGTNNTDGTYLNDTDTSLGLEAEGVIYPKSHERDLEEGEVINLASTRERIDVDKIRAINKWNDQLRVITRAGTGSSYGMNQEVSSHVTNDHQILMTDANEPIIDFDEINPAENSIWPDVLDPRHFGKINTLKTDGSIELLLPSDLLPDARLWRQ